MAESHWSRKVIRLRERRERDDDRKAREMQKTAIAQGDHAKEDIMQKVTASSRVEEDPGEMERRNAEK